jgi:hypothetical protein
LLKHRTQMPSNSAVGSALLMRRVCLQFGGRHPFHCLFHRSHLLPESHYPMLAPLARIREQIQGRKLGTFGFCISLRPVAISAAARITTPSTDACLAFAPQLYARTRGMFTERHDCVCEKNSLAISRRPASRLARRGARC